MITVLMVGEGIVDKMSHWSLKVFSSKFLVATSKFLE